MTPVVEKTGTRDRIVNATAELFRVQGYNGTGVKQVVAEADAPFGSLYHFFPGGKSELGAEVVRTAGDFFARVVADAMAPARDPVSAVRLGFSGAAETLTATNFEDACPIATVALETASTNEELRTACAEVFESWVAGLAATYAGLGIPERRARELATGFICALEGAFILCRATRTTHALEIAGELVAKELDAELDAL